MLVCPKSVIQCMLYIYIFLIAYVFPYICFPNHALNWECSKDEQFLFKNYSQMKKGEIHFHEELYF